MRHTQSCGAIFREIAISVVFGIGKRSRKFEGSCHRLVLGRTVARAKPRERGDSVTASATRPCQRRHTLRAGRQRNDRIARRCQFNRANERPAVTLSLFTLLITRHGRITPSNTTTSASPTLTIHRAPTRPTRYKSYRAPLASRPTAVMWHLPKMKSCQDNQRRRRGS